MKRYQMLALLLVMVIMSVGSQAVMAQDSHDHKSMMGEKEKVAVVNNLCPIMKTEIDSEKVPAELTRDFMDQKVGFCCTSCLAKWDELNATEKAEKLKAVVSDKM